VYPHRGPLFTPQQRVAGQKALLGLRIQIENLQKALKVCRG
jgi:hypothetical protein